MQRVVARARRGHVWIFSNEVVSPPVVALPAGGAVEVVDPSGKFLGRGYANPHSLISIRLFAGGTESPDDPALFVDRVRRALRLRERVCPGRQSYRLIAGEADGLPGLIVDRYESVLSAQVTTLGMEQRKPLIEAALREVVAPTGVVFRGDVPVRTYEGLPLEKGVWWGDVPDRAPFEENGVRYEADLIGGQKTGFFFDQAENRAFLAPRCAGARVLDVFAHMGGWALTAMVHGAGSAATIESSAAANALIARNAELNGVKLDIHEGDAREVMASLPAGSFDIVCVDPPAFAKNRKSAGPALHAYKQVNAAGARLVAPGGLLFSSSCSHPVEPARFEEEVVAGIRHAGRSPRLIRRGGQAPDHPILPGVPETEYLKHLVFALG
jgi:23S rRNA (cytosine1962-C5)-methyltransferase